MTGAKFPKTLVFPALALAGLVAACTVADDAAPSDGVEHVYSAGLPVIDPAGNALGAVAFQTSCAPAANDEMRLGISLLHHMTYTQAEAAFRRATEADPQCALGYWGVALTFLHPLWPDLPSDQAFADGWELLQTAREIATAESRAGAYIGALEAYYRDGPSRTEADRLASYAAAWATVAADDPTDSEAALFNALSLIATASDADKTHGTRVRAGEIAEGVLAAIADHPGALHYVIHAYDVPLLADRGLTAARTYGAVAPENTHALHMTSHIFTHVGLWEESIEFNERSAEAALKNPINGTVSFHHLHALDYLAYGHLQRGNDDAAQEVLDHMAGLGPVFPNAASAYAFAAMPARIALERGDWTAAAAVPVRWPESMQWDAFPHLEAIAEFAHALGLARTGRVAEASVVADRLQTLALKAGELPDAYDWETQVKIQEMGARAWIEYEQGNAELALRMMSDAADLEATTEKHPVTPGVVLPARELLGDMLTALGRYEQAGTAYAAALERTPNRLNSLYGAAYAAEQAGDMERARTLYSRLTSGVDEAAGSLPQVAHARTFLSS